MTSAFPCIALLLFACRLGAQPARGQLPDAPPRAWIAAGEGFGLALGDGNHRTTIMHVPRVAAGLRLTHSAGIEVGGEFIQVLDKTKNTMLAQGTPPSYTGAVGRLVFMAPDRTNEWARTLAVGAGSFQPSGQDRRVLGFEAMAESAFATYPRSTWTGGARLVFIPKDEGARFVYLAASLTVRSRRLCLGTC